MLWSISKNTKKYIVPTMLVIVTIVLLFSPNFVFAQEACDGWIECGFESAMFGIAKAILGIGSWVASAGGAFLDITIKFTLDTATYNLSGVKIGWEVFRDLANMAFIFILLYIAFMTVLQVGGIQTKRLVTHVIIAALLVNFSFFFTGVVIDVGNIVGGFLYNTLVPTPEQTIGNTLSASLNISTIFDPETVGIKRPLLFALLGTVFFLTAGFVFIAAGFLFIQRTVILMLVLISSPIAFVAAVLPAGAAQTFWKKWVSALIGNTLVLPVFLTLLAVIFLIIVNDSLFGIATGGGVPAEESLGDLLDTERANYAVGSSAGILMNFVILIALLVAALNISKAAAGEAGAAAAKIGGRITRGVVRVGRVGVATGVAVGAGAAALAYRQTAGRYARRRTQDKDLQEQAQTSKYAAWKLKTFQGAAGVSGDFRNIKGVSKALGLVGIKGVRGGGRGGFAKKMDDKVKKDEKFADSLDMTDKEREKYAENLRDKKSWSRLGLWTSRRDKEAAQKIGKLKERKQNRRVEGEISELKKTQDYEGKKDARFKAEQDVDTKRKAYAQARSDGNHSNADEIQYELENAQKVLSEKKKDLTLLDDKIKELKTQRKDIKRKEKGIDDSLKDYFSENPIDTGKDI